MRSMKIASRRYARYRPVRRAAFIARHPTPFGRSIKVFQIIGISSSIAAVDIVGLRQRCSRLRRWPERPPCRSGLRPYPCGRRARASPTSRFFSPSGRFSYLANSASTPSQCSPSTTPGEIALTLMPCLIRSESGRLGQADHRRLGRAIDRDQRLAAPTGLARHVDDLAAVDRGDHVPRHRLHGEQRPCHIDGEDAS